MPTAIATNPYYVNPTALSPIGATDTFDNHCFVCGRFGQRWQPNSRKWICKHPEGEVQWFDYDLPRKEISSKKHYAAWDLDLIDMSDPYAPNHP